MVIFTANPILSKYVRLCPRFSPFFPGFPENRAEFLTFPGQSFFLLPVIGSPPLQNRFVIKVWIKVVVHRGASANRRFGIGMSDFGGQPPHSKVSFHREKSDDTSLQVGESHHRDDRCHVAGDVVVGKIRAAMVAKISIGSSLYGAD